MKFGNMLASILISLIMHSTLSYGAVTINVVESGGDVVATASGSVNTTDLVRNINWSSIGSFVRGSASGADGQIILAPVSSSTAIASYTISTGVAFSTGPLKYASSSSGTRVGFLSTSGSSPPDLIYLETDYVSNAPISSTATWSGQTFADLGLIQGTYVVTWGTGANADSLTLNIGAVAPPSTYSVGGTVSGLTGTGLELQNNGGDTLAVAAATVFTFAAELPDLATYAVTVSKQPTGQTCGVTGGDNSLGGGAIAGADVTSVIVTCVTDKADQTITGLAADPATGVVEGSSALSATASSGLAVSFGSSTTAVCTVAGTTVSYLAAGICTVTADQAGNDSYNAAPQETLNITVGKADQTITGLAANPASGVVDGTSTLSVGGAVTTTSAVQAVQSGQKPPTTKASGIPVTYGSNTLTICTVSGSTVSYLAIGTCTVTANQAGDTNYNPAPQVTLDINVTATPPAKPYVPIPTLSPWGLVAMFLMMLAIAGMIVRRRTRG